MVTSSSMPVLDLAKYPAVSQTRRNPRSTSRRYAFIPTTRVLGVLGEFGWHPVQVSEARARLDRIGYQKHLVRLRHVDDLDRCDGEVADVLLYNSHSGECSFRLMAGVYRFVCSNGLVVGDTVQEHRIEHRGYADESVANAVGDIMGQAPRLLDRIERFKAIDMMPQEQEAFAESAGHLRFPVDDWSVEPRELLRCRRSSDSSASLWTVFNRVQENMLNGGALMLSRTTNKVRRAKRIRSIQESVRLNQALWNLAESVAQWN